MPSETTATPVGVLRTVQVGTPRRYPAVGAEGPWETSFVREPSPERRRLFFTHLEGNAQADRKNHGTPNQALLLYADAHYPAWREELGLPEIGPGGFGENFTVVGSSEATVCVGDTYAVGDACIQVTGPRYPCTKIGRRWNIPALTGRVAETGRTGWYCRVLKEGWVEPGLTLELIDRPHPAVSVALVNHLVHGGNRDLGLAREVAACPALEEWWQRLIVRRATGKEW